MKQIITKSNFDEIVKNSGKTVIVDFWAEWCGPCRMLAPIVEEVAEELDGEKYVVGKVNVDEEPELSLEFGIMSIPTLIVFKNGELYRKSVGLIDKEELLSLLD